MTSLRIRQVGSQAVLFVVLIVVGLFSIFPFLKMVIGSLQEPYQILGGFSSLTLPMPPRFDNYVEMFNYLPIARQLLNSLINASGTTLLLLGVSTVAGYTFAKHEFRGKNVLFVLFLLTMAVPITAVTVPLFMTMRDLGWINTYMAVIIPSAANGFGVFWMRQYIAGAIPDELLDAARLDGAGEWRIVASIVVPLVRPALAALGLLWFMFTWNDFFWPVIVLNSQDMLTVPVGVGSMISRAADTVRLGPVMAGSVVGTLPLVVVFLLLQRHFVAGLMEGATK
jgi:ABC-type glycerol-3-phosphate transport system permease component